MSQNRIRCQALHEFRQSLLKHEDVAVKFRDAFPELAERLLPPEG